jgi:hypothetical protein
MKRSPAASCLRSASAGPSASPPPLSGTCSPPPLTDRAGPPSLGELRAGGIVNAASSNAAPAMLSASTSAAAPTASASTSTTLATGPSGPLNRPAPSCWASWSAAPTSPPTRPRWRVPAWPMAPRHKTRVRPGTWVQYQRKVDTHLLPAIGQVPLQQRTTAMLNALYAELLAHDVAPGPSSMYTPPSARPSTTTSVGACWSATQPCTPPHPPLAAASSRPGRRRSCAVPGQRP